MKGKIISYLKGINPKTLLVIIVLFGLALRLIFFSGYIERDDKHYLAQAYKFSIGDFSPGDSVWTVRLGVIAPTACFFSLFGINKLTAVLFPLLCSIGIIILIYYLGKLLFDGKVGLVASFLLSFFPLDVIFATHLYPDIPISFFITLSIFLFLKGERSEKKIYYLISGIFLGISYLNRLSGLLIGLFFIFYVLYKRKLKICYCLIPLGFLLILGLELVLYYFQTGNPLFRYQKTYGERWCIGKSEFLYRGTNWWIEPLLMLTTNQEFGIFYYFVLPIIVYFLFKRNIEVNILLIWLIPVLLYLSYGTVSFSHYLYLRREERYTSMITTPALLILAYFLVKKANKKFYYSSLFLLLLTSIGCVLVDNSRIKDYVSRQIYAFHKEHPNTDMLISPTPYFGALFYSKFQIDIHLKLSCVNDYPDSDGVRSIKKIYPEVPISLKFDQIDNAYVAVRKKYINTVPSNAKLIKIIQQPKRFYYPILEKWPFSHVAEKLFTFYKPIVEGEVVYIFYIDKHRKIN
ncbi:MAG: glycosyltransferase family 39 protein [bacterium]